MIIGKLVNLDIEFGDVHEETEWEISTTQSFDEGTCVKHKTTNPDELVVYVFKETPSPEAPYYGRAKYRTKKKGWSNWNNLEIIDITSMDDMSELYELPARLGIPRVETYNYRTDIEGKVVRDGDALKNDNHPIIDFCIAADGYISATSADHVATSWYVETLSRDVIWKSEFDTVNLVDIKVKNIILENNKIYRCRAVHHSATFDVSDGGSKTIQTAKEKNVALRMQLERDMVNNPNFNPDVENVLTVPLEPNTKKVEISIDKYTAFGSSNVFKSIAGPGDNAKAGVAEIRITAGTLKRGSNYIIKYRTHQSSLNKPDQITIDPFEVLFFAVRTAN